MGKNRLEHIYYLEGFGGNQLRHSYGYELRYNPTNWMKIQAGVGTSMILWTGFGFGYGITISPNASFQFGKNWLWTEIGIEGSYLASNIHNDITNRTITPRIGLHFKFARTFEFGVNYTPVFEQTSLTILKEHWLSVRLRFVMVSKKRKRELGKWKLGFRNGLPFEPYPEKKPSKRRILHEEFKKKYREVNQKRNENIKNRKESKH